MMTDKGIYVPSDLNDLKECFRKFCPNSMLLDVGSGNGAVLELAWKNSATVSGVEIDKEFYETTKFKRWVTHGHFDKIDFSIYNIIYYFLKGTDEQDKLAEKINEKAREKVIIYRRGSNQEETDKFIAKLTNFKTIETFKYIYILNRV
jgi:precorrin-6B methylase 2